jgi:hypothetical protein
MGFIKPLPLPLGNPHPWLWVRVFAGAGAGCLKKPQGYPPRSLTGLDLALTVIFTKHMGKERQ